LDFPISRFFLIRKPITPRLSPGVPVLSPLRGIKAFPKRSHWGKPPLVIPVAGQKDRKWMAGKLVESGFGESCHVADLGVRLSGFMERAGVYAQRIADAQAVSEGSWKCRDETSRAAALVEAFAVESLQRIEWRTPKPVFSWYPRPEWSA